MLKQENSKSGEVSGKLLKSFFVVFSFLALFADTYTEAEINAEKNPSKRKSKIDHNINHSRQKTRKRIASLPDATDNEKRAASSINHLLWYQHEHGYK